MMAPSKKAQMSDKVANNSHYVSRINQLNAKFLDDEFLNLLKNLIRDALQYLPKNPFSKFEPEIDFLLKIIAGQLLIRGGSSVGQKLLGLRFSSADTRWRWMFLLVSVFPSWLYARIPLFLQCVCNRDSNDRVIAEVRRRLDTIECGVRALSLINTLLFIRNGVHCTLLSRLMCLRVVPIDDECGAAGAFPDSAEYMNLSRLLLCRETANVLLLATPLLNWRRLRTRLLRLFSWRRRSRPVCGLSGVTRLTTATVCVACRLSPCQPLALDCGHVICHWCCTEERGDTSVAPVECTECRYLTPHGHVTPVPCVNQQKLP